MNMMFLTKHGTLSPKEEKKTNFKEKSGKKWASDTCQEAAKLDWN